MYDPKSIIIHNHKGGTGKTMLAVHLANYLAEQGQEWCLLDIDEQYNAMSWLTGHEWEGEEAIRLAGIGSRADIIATLDPEQALVHPRIIVDTPPAESLIMNLLDFIELGEDDIIICPVNGRLSIDGSIKVAEEVAHTGCRVVLVANMTDPNDQHALEEIRALEEMERVEELNVEVFRMAIPRNEQFMREAELAGVPVWNLPHSQRTYAVRALEAFCQWIADGANPDENTLHQQYGKKVVGVSTALRRRLWS